MKLVSFRTLRSMCLDLIIFLIPLSLIFLAFPYVISVFAPFIVGGILYLTANPLNKFFLKNKLPKSLCAFLSLGIISLGVFFFLRIIGGKILQELSSALCYAVNRNIFPIASGKLLKYGRHIIVIGIAVADKQDAQGRLICKIQAFSHGVSF